jgi:endo-beta-N-acetylglucosaminidase D
MANAEKFVETKSKNGWKLIINKDNKVLISTTLYDASGAFKEIKTFNLQIDNEMIFFKRYIKLFEEDPDKNSKAMMAMTIRK